MPSLVLCERTQTVYPKLACAIAGQLFENPAPTRGAVTIGPDVHGGLPGAPEPHTWRYPEGGFGCVPPVVSARCSRIGVALKWKPLRPGVDHLTGAVTLDERFMGSSKADLAALEWALRLAETWEGVVAAADGAPARGRPRPYRLRHARSTRRTAELPACDASSSWPGRSTTRSGR